MGSEGEGGLMERGGVRKRGGVKEGGGARERGVRERGGVRKRGRVRERGGSEVYSLCVGAHGRGRVSCVGAYQSWVCIVCGHVSVMGAYRAWVRIVRGRVSVMGVVVVHGWGIVVHVGWSSVGGGEGGHRGPWALSVGTGYRLRVLGVAGAHWVPLWALGIIRRRWVDVGCVLWALGILRVGSLLGVRSVGLLLGMRSLLGAVVVLGLSWDERGGVDVVTYCDVTTNDDFRSLFIVKLPRHCQQRGTCERGMSGGGLTSTRRHRLRPLVGCCGFEEPVLMGMVFGDGE